VRYATTPVSARQAARPEDAPDALVRSAAVAAGTHASGASARERILDAAYDLFSRQGIRAVGIDAIIERSGVARMTLYRHFTSKDALVLAFLERRERLWSKDWLEREVEQRADDPQARLLAIFDVFDTWFQRDDFEGCSFINVLLEISEPTDPLNRASRDHLASIRDFIERLAAAAAIADPQAFARQWHILMKGSIVAAGEGDHQAARRARELGALLLQQKASPPPPG
jgi:AcrR family transcriptional regulator